MELCWGGKVLFVLYTTMYFIQIVIPHLFFPPVNLLSISLIISKINFKKLQYKTGSKNEQSNKKNNFDVMLVFY